MSRDRRGDEPASRNEAHDTREPSTAAPGKASPSGGADSAESPTHHLHPAPERDHPLFAPEAVIAGRYRILRFVARGGGGEVYEAEDRELGGRVALKTVDPLADERRFERFRREILLARRVTHPNACRIYDVGHHQNENGNDIVFLTMEFLAGETLAAYLSARGPLPIPEARVLVRQMADGLDAAHQAGVVHRDFKSSNVMLVPDDTQPGGRRAVITDFGLARSGRTGSAARHTMTADGIVVGTPAYMAPEQVTGDRAGPPADVYAFGVVLYEVVTGQLPFQGESVLSTAVKRLREPPPSPRTERADLDPQWERTILKCLALRPAERFSSAGAAVAALSRKSPRSRRRLRRSMWTALAVAVGLLAIVLRLRTTHGGTFAPAAPSAPSAPSERLRESAAPSAGSAASPSAPAARRAAVAVLGFTNLAQRDDAAWLSTGLAEMLASELAASDRLRTIPGETVARMRGELALTDAVSLAADTLTRIRNHVGTDYVVLGSYTLVGAGGDTQIRLDLRVQDTEMGRELPAIRVNGAEANLFTLVAQAGAELRALLGAAAPAQTLPRARPTNPEAARLYAEGLDRFRRFEPLAARDLLLQATAAEPGFAPAHAALAEAWQQLGYDARARAASERAYGLAADLRPEERLAVEARFRETAREWERAIALRRELWRDYPDDVQHGIRLGRVLLDANQAPEALRLSEELARLPAPAGTDPAIALIEADAAIRLSDHARAIAAARRAAGQAEKLGSSLAAAAAGLRESEALYRQGDADAAMRVAGGAHAAFAAAGDRSGAARALRLRALALRSKGSLDEARRTTEEALAGSRKVGDQKAIAAALNTLGNLAYELGQLTVAGERYEEVLATTREIDDERNVAAALGNLANVRLLTGDPVGAITAHEESLALKRRLGLRGGVAVSLIGLATALLERGDPGAAQPRLEEALRIAAETGEKSSEAYALFSLGEVRRAAGDAEGAGRHHEEALRIRETLGEQGAVADSRVALGVLAMDRNDAKTAIDHARAAIEEFASEGQIDGETTAQILLGRGLVRAGKLAAANAAISRAADLQRRGENRSLRLQVELATAGVEAATQKTAAARRRLEAAAREAAGHGLVSLDLEARIAVAEIALRDGDDAARSRLAAIAADAETRGLRLLASQAREKSKL